MSRLLRRRSSIDYNSEGASSSALTVESASKWKEDTVSHMNIKVMDSDTMFPNVDLPSIAQSILIPEWTDKNWLKSANIEQYDNKVKTLIKKIEKVSVHLENTTESMVDGFMSSLLNLMGFDEYPCFLYPQYSYHVRVGPESSRIRATPDFSITTENNNVMLVIEDKNSTGATYSNKWKEDQVMGELFVAAHYIAARQDKKATYPVNVYAARVIGTKFTFYKATATLDYIKESARSGMSEDNQMVVERYPPVEDSPLLTAYDICNVQDRKHILESLFSIKTLMV